jgi:hypothetical protein
MQILQFPFTRGGFHHELLKREGLVCLVKRSKPAHWHFEIVKVKIAPAQTVFDKLYPEREVYPSDEDWGQIAFTLPSNQPDLANEAFRSLCEAQRDAILHSV